MGFSRCVIFALFFIATVIADDLQPSKKVQSSSWPHLTCFSLELVTFRCLWDVVPFQNLTEPGDLKLFYKLDSKNGVGTWQECPSYSRPVKNECYFNKDHTTIWYTYAIQLRSGSSQVLDKQNFSVEEIVFPDPPEVLNWTLLNLASTDLLCDVLVNWDVPSSAAESVKVGWMTLMYEAQYRQNGSEQWNSMGVLEGTEAYIYGLQTNTKYEVRVRSKMRVFNFGDFSDSIIILVPSKGSRIPVAVMLILTIAGIGLIVMLIMVSRQQKIMVLLLPPVPGPKIKGIDPDLLKKGQMTEFTSVLSEYPSLRPEFYNNDPWVEFIEVDIDEPIETLEDFDTPLLFSDSRISDSPPTSSTFQDDDSGRASCCDPDLSDHDHHDANHPSTRTQDGFNTSSPANLGSVVPLGQDLAWPSSVYSQVTDVMPDGEAVLSPKRNVTNASSSKDIKDKQSKNLQLMLILDERGYTSDMDVTKMSMTSLACQKEPSLKPEAEIPPQEVTPTASTFPILAMPTPPPEYTMVDGVDWNNSLFLRNPAPCPPAFLKSGPEGYLTPELLDKIVK